ncbi:MAG: efflux RND transporter permease subunit, partial [Verrucomicrobiota bacterium]
LNAEMVVDYSVSVHALLSVVRGNAVLGLFIVLVTLILFLNFRVAFWTAVGIPVSVMFGFLVMPFFGATINFITLLGMIIILGMLVDDAIIDVENVYKRLRENIKTPGPKTP